MIAVDYGKFIAVIILPCACVHDITVHVLLLTPSPILSKPGKRLPSSQSYYMCVVASTHVTREYITLLGCLAVA